MSPMMADYQTCCQ